MSTQLPNISLLQAAGPFVHSCQAGICRFKSAWKELNLNARVSSKRPNLGRGSHSHLTPAETPGQGAEARRCPQLAFIEAVKSLKGLEVTLSSRIFPAT